MKTLNIIAIILLVLHISGTICLSTPVIWGLSLCLAASLLISFVVFALLFLGAAALVIEAKNLELKGVV